MDSPHRRPLAALVVAAALLPTTVSAQGIARSFDELQRTVTVGQTVFVIEKNGRQTKGTVADLSPSSLLVLTPDPSTFPQGTVAQIRRPDRLWKGTLIGLSVGVLPGMLAGFGGCAESNEPGCVRGPIYGALFVGGISAAIGAGIDAAVGKAGRLIYLAPAESGAAGPPQVERLRDPLWNGLAIGAAVGGGIGLASAAVASRNNGNAFLVAEVLGAGLVSGLAVGAVAGLVIDALNRERSPTYVSPASTARRTGISFSPVLDTTRKAVLASVWF